MTSASEVTPLAVQSMRGTDPGQPNAVTAYFAGIRRTVSYGTVSRWVPITIAAGRALVKFVQSRAFHNLLNVFTGRTSSGDHWTENPKLLRTIGVARLAGGIIAGVAAVYTLIEQGIEIKDEVRKGRWREGIDAALRCFEALSDTADSIAVTATGLSMAKIVEASQVAWATPLAMVAAATSIVSIVIHAREIKHDKEISRKLESSADLNWLNGEISNYDRDADYFVRRRFGIINREKYAAQMKHIILEGSPEDKEILRNALKARVSDKVTSHKLAILCSVIGLIGICLVFFATAPWVIPTGLGIIGFGGFLSSLKYIEDKRSVARLEAAIDQAVRFQAIPQTWIDAHAPFAKRGI